MAEKKLRGPLGPYLVMSVPSLRGSGYYEPLDWFQTEEAARTAMERFKRQGEDVRLFVEVLPEDESTEGESTEDELTGKWREVLKQVKRAGPNSPRLVGAHGRRQKKGAY